MQVDLTKNIESQEILATKGRKIKKFLLISLLIYLCFIILPLVASLCLIISFENFNTQDFINLTNYTTGVNIIIMISGICAIFGFYQLSHFTHTPLFRYIVSGIILAIIYAIFISILVYACIYSPSPDLFGLSGAFGGIISIAFVIYILYLSYKICAAMREITSQNIFMLSFKIAAFGSIFGFCASVYALIQIFFLSSEMLLLPYIFAFTELLGIISQGIFILGIIRTKTLKIREF